MNITWIGSPNYNEGRGIYKPYAIIIHIMDGTLSGTDSWFLNKKSEVSAHYGIGKNGDIHQYVKEENTAWHAGTVSKPLNTIFSKVNPNLFTIGIEHEGKPQDAWTPEMIESSAFLIAEICLRWRIPIDRNHIFGHYEINSMKPNCPAKKREIINDLIVEAFLAQKNLKSQINRIYG